MTLLFVLFRVRWSDLQELIKYFESSCYVVMYTCHIIHINLYLLGWKWSNVEFLKHILYSVL